MVPATLAHYRIIRPLGAGGMGEIFLAEDTKLGRQVALKVLSPALAGDPARRDRFEREARAVAALNHPNIVTLHSVEEQDGTLFLTLELVEGRTLTDVIPRTGMPIEQWLDVAIPLADAVGAAHQRGITHRDLKPANVMVSDEGRVKVLDFGIAKLQEDVVAAGDPETVAAQLTGEGHIIGTFAYMSPEQAQGRPADPRSDVFSLGILLYEMATGERPFAGDNNVSLLSAILKDAPPPVAERRQDLPSDVERILRRCLGKHPEQRYPTAKELRNDLLQLKQQVDSGVPRREETRTHGGQATVPTGVVRHTRRRGALVAAVAAVAAIGVAGGWWYTRPVPGPAPEPFRSLEMRRLTNTGHAGLAAISPDGRYVVHVVRSADTPSLWLRQVSTPSNVQIVAPMPGRYGGLTFTPDGESVLYTFYPPATFASLFQIPLLGGPARKLVDDVDTAPAFSPDGKRMAFVRATLDGEATIVLVNADGTGERPLATRRPPDEYPATRLAWSPDGKQIAAFVGMMPRQRSRIVLVDVDTGEQRDLTEPSFDFPGQLAWLPDGTALVCDAVGQGAGYGASGQLWSVSYPGATVRRLTNDVANYSGVTATRDGLALAAVQQETRTNLWVVPRGDPARARPVTGTSTGREGVVGLTWTPDGRLVYGAITQGSWDIWIKGADESPPRQLTSDPGVEATPAVFPDGKSVAFITRSAGEYRFRIRAVDLDGQNLRDLPADAVQPGLLHVGSHYVYFRGLVGGRVTIQRVPIAGGPTTSLFPDPAAQPPLAGIHGISRDERWVLGTTRDPKVPGIRLAVVPVGGPEKMRTFPIPFVRAATGFAFSWEPSGDAFNALLVRDGATNVWQFPLDGSAPRPITSFPSEQIFSSAWSWDGKVLAVSRGTESADVVVIASGR